MNGSSEFATRVDPESGVVERLEYVQTPRGRLYTWIAFPRGARACVLICSSILGDFTANYHRERLLGRALVVAGLGAIRFHYAGEGNSEGDPQAMTFQTLCDDARSIWDHATESRPLKFALMGTRVGALVAAATVGSKPSIPLALWEPLADPLRPIHEAERATRISHVAHGTEAIQAWREKLEITEVVDLLGYEVHRAMVMSLAGVELKGLIGEQPRPLWIASFRNKSATSSRLAESLMERGFTVESEGFDISESWWLHSEAPPVTGDLIAATTRWLRRVLD